MNFNVGQVGHKCWKGSLWQSSRKPSGPKTKASEFEVGSVKIENQEVRLAFSFDQTFYGILQEGL
jgi:hypothetical protein